MDQIENNISPFCLKFCCKFSKTETNEEELKKIFQFSFSKDSKTTKTTAIAKDASIKNGPSMNTVPTKLTKSTDPAKQMPSANLNNSQILFNNLNNLNKRYKNNENTLILTNSENHDEGYYNEFSNANDTKPQKIFTKKHK